MATVGVYGSQNFPVDLAKKSFAGMITRLMPNGTAPLFALTSLLKEETATQIEHGYYSKTMVFPSAVLSASVAIGDTTLNVTSSANILAGMILRSDSTNENMLVTAVLSPTQIAVQRGLGSVAVAAISSAVNLWMVGNAFEEASLRPGSMIITPTRVTNYTQIFRNSWAISETVRATMVVAGDSTVQESRQDCAAFHATAIESALFFGQKYLGARNGQSFHTMDGLINIITQNASANVTTLGSTTTFTQLEAALDPVFQQTTDPKGGATRMLFVGGTARRVLHHIARLNSTYQVTTNETQFGQQYDTFRIPRGSFTVVEHPLFNAYGASSTWAKMGVVVDMATFNVAYLTGRKTVSKDFNMDGTPVDSGVDSVGGTLTTEMTCLVKNPAANAVLYNFTAGAAG